MGIRIATRQADKDAIKRVESGLAFIAAGIPDAAFNAESADYVMSHLSGEPSMSDIRSAVHAWWADHAPEDETGMPADIAASGLLMTDKLWCKQVRKAAALQAGTVLGLVRKQSPAAFRWLFENDVEAFRLARKYGWSPSESSDVGQDWLDPAAVERSVRTCLGYDEDGTPPTERPADVRRALELLHALVGRSAPQNLHLIPPIDSV